MTSEPDHPLSQELLAQRGFVRRLASSLVGDDSRADDLAQDVWVRALESPPRGTGGLRAWLSQVTRRLASNDARGERRRLLHERRAAHSEGGGAERGTGRIESAERGYELQRHVVDAVQTLDERYRQPILLRYFLELPHSEIAEELGLPLATVRTRLQRGLAKLRERLDREYGGDRARWMGGLGLVLEKGWAVPVANATGKSILGGLLVGTVSKICVGLALASCMGWWIWGGAGELVEPLASVPDILNGSGEAPLALENLVDRDADRRRSEVVASSPQVIEDAEEDAAPALERGWIVRGQVHDLDAAELEFVVVTVRPIQDMSRAGQAFPTARVGPTGLFQVDVGELFLQEGKQKLEVDALEVVADHPGFLPRRVRLQVGEEHSPLASLDELEGLISWWADITLRPAAVIGGSVVYGDGGPAAGALVCAWRMIEQGDKYRPDFDPADCVPCDSRGRFLLRVPTAGSHAVSALMDDMRPATVIADAIGGTRIDLEDPLVLGEGAAIEGLLVGVEEGAFRSNVNISLVGRFEMRYSVLMREGFRGQQLCWFQGGMEQIGLMARIDEHGKFRFAGLLPEVYRLSVKLIPNTYGTTMYLGSPVPARVGTEPDHVLKVRAPAQDLAVVPNRSSLAFTIDGDPELGATGTLFVQRTARRGASVAIDRVSLLPTLIGTPGEVVVVEIQIAGMTPWSKELVFPAGGGRSVCSVRLEPGQEPSSLELSIASDAGHPVDDVTLTLSRVGDNGRAETWKTASVVDGVARFETLLPGRYVGSLNVGRSWIEGETDYLAVQIPLDLKPGQTLRDAVTFERGGRLEITCKGRDGEPVGARAELRGADGEAVEVEFRTQEGRSALCADDFIPRGGPSVTHPNLAPGTYALHLNHSGFEPLILPVTVRVGATVPIEAILEPK